MGVDDQFLQGKAKICYFSKINRSLSRERSLQGRCVGIHAADLPERAARQIRLRVDLRGNKSLPGAMLAQDQDRAVAFGNSGNRVLNPRFGR